jgi:uncharacterized phage-associated protein
MPHVRDVARQLIRFASLDEEGEAMTPMRLQKLLYYCQGWHLAWYGQPLFAERIEAWRHGPVVPVVYAEPWGRGNDPIPDDGQPINLSEVQRKAIEQVWNHFEKFSACGLREATHAEKPWKDHYHPDANERCSEEIPVAELQQFFEAEYEKQTGDRPPYLDDTDEGVPLTLDQLPAAVGW